MNATRKSWLVTLVLSGLALAYVFALFLPQQQVICQMRQELQAKQDFTLQAAGLDMAVQTTRDELKAAAAFVAQCRGSLTDDDNIADVFEAINRQAESAGTQTQRFEPQTPVTLETLTQMPVVLEATGNFHQIFDLMARLEATNSTIWINQIELERNSKDSEALTCEVSLAIFADNRENSD